MRAQIEVLLSIWGRWVVKRESGALGYPSQSSGFGGWQPPKGDTYTSREIASYTSADIVAIDQSVRCLPSIYRLAVVEVYQHGGGMAAVARRMGLDRKTLGKYLNGAYDRIALDIENQFPHNSAQLDRVHQCAPVEPAATR